MTQAVTHRSGDRNIFRKLAANPSVDKHKQQIREQLTTPRGRIIAGIIGFTLVAGIASGIIWGTTGRNDSNPNYLATNTPKINGESVEQYAENYTPPLFCTNRMITPPGEIGSPDPLLVDGQTYQIMPVITPEAKNYSSLDLASVAYLSKLEQGSVVVNTNFQVSNNVNNPITLTYQAGYDIRVVVLDLTSTGINKVTPQSAQQIFTIGGSVSLPDANIIDCNSDAYAVYGPGSRQNQQ
jgi:hypothetical protein